MPDEYAMYIEQAEIDAGLRETRRMYSLGQAFGGLIDMLFPGAPLHYPLPQNYPFIPFPLGQHKNPAKARKKARKSGAKIGRRR